MKAEEVRIFKAPLQRVISVITDYERYPEFLTSMADAEILKELRDKETLVRFQLELIMRLEYELLMKEDLPNCLEWKLRKSEHMLLNQGAWHLRALNDRETEIRYELEVEFQGRLPQSIHDRVMTFALPRTLEEFRLRIESQF